MDGIEKNERTNLGTYYSRLKENPFDIIPPYGEDHSFFMRLKKLGIKAYGAVVMDINKSQITVKPVQDVVDLAGSFKTKVTKSPLAARAEMEKSYERV